MQYTYIFCREKVFSYVYMKAFRNTFMINFQQIFRNNKVATDEDSSWSYRSSHWKGFEQKDFILLFYFRPATILF